MLAMPMPEKRNHDQQQRAAQTEDNVNEDALVVLELADER